MWEVYVWECRDAEFPPNDPGSPERASPELLVLQDAQRPGPGRLLAPMGTYPAQRLDYTRTILTVLITKSFPEINIFAIFL